MCPQPGALYHSHTQQRRKVCSRLRPFASKRVRACLPTRTHLQVRELELTEDLLDQLQGAAATRPEVGWRLVGGWLHISM